MKILSLIIPAYNSEAFLETCVASIPMDSLGEKLEVIIVNDGSQDATGEIASEMVRKYPNCVRLLSQENRGHGGALNTGIAAATGKYLKVIDADDWVQTDCIPEFLRALERCDADVVLTHFRTVDITSGEEKFWRCYPPAFERQYTLEEIMGQWKNFDRCLTFHGITYRRDFYLRRGITLSEHVFYEDHEFATFPCCRAAAIVPLDLLIYNYRIGDQSQSVALSNQLRRLGDTETVLHRLVSEYQRELPELSSSGRRYARRKTQGQLLSYLTTTLLGNPDRKAGRRQAKAMMEFFRDELPETAKLAKNQYRILRMLHSLRIGRNAFDGVLRSRLYNRLRGNHNFY